MTRLRPFLAALVVALLLLALGRGAVLLNPQGCTQAGPLLVCLWWGD